MYTSAPRRHSVYDDRLVVLELVAAKVVATEGNFHRDRIFVIYQPGFVAEQPAGIVSEIRLGVAVHIMVELEADLALVDFTPPDIQVKVIAQPDDFAVGQVGRRGRRTGTGTE